MSLLNVALWGIITCAPWWGVVAYCCRGRAELGHRALRMTAWVWMLAGLAIHYLRGSALDSLCGTIDGFPLLPSILLRVMAPDSVMTAWGVAASGAVLWWVFSEGRRVSFAELCLVALIPLVWLCDHLAWLLAAQGLLTGLTAWLVGRDRKVRQEESFCRAQSHGLVSGLGRTELEVSELTCSTGGVSHSLPTLGRWWFSNAWADVLMVMGGLLGAIELETFSISATAERARVEWMGTRPERGALVGLLVWLGLWGRLQLIPFLGLRHSARSWSVQTNMLVWWIAPLPLAVKWWSWGSAWWTGVAVMRSLIGEWSLWAACLSLWCAVCITPGRAALPWLWSTSFCLASSLTATHPLEEIAGGFCLSLLAATWLGLWFEKTPTNVVQHHPTRNIRVWNVGLLTAIASGGAWWEYVRRNPRPIPSFQGENELSFSDGSSLLTQPLELPALTAVVAGLIGLQCVRLALLAHEETVGRRVHRVDGLILVSLAMICLQGVSYERMQEMLGAPFSAWLAAGGLAGLGVILSPHSFQTTLSRLLAPLISVAQQQFLLPRVGYALVLRPLCGLSLLCGHMERLLEDREPGRVVKDLLRNAIQQSWDAQITAEYAILSLIMTVAALVMTMMWLAA